MFSGSKKRGGTTTVFEVSFEISQTQAIILSDGTVTFQCKFV